METAQRELLGRVLASPPFAHAELLRRILRFLFEQTRKEGSPPSKEYDIAVRGINRPDSFDPKTDATVRVSIAAIRNRLRTYFETEGRNEPLRLLIPKGEYRVRFVEIGEHAEEHETGVMGSSVRNFWSPYSREGARNILLYTDLLFFRDNEGNYFRNIYLNDPAAGPDVARRYLPDAKGDIRLSYHFVSAGEMAASATLLRGFAGMGLPTEVANSRLISWCDLRTANLIVLGSARTNAYLATLQGEERLTLREDDIQDAAPQPGAPSCYRAARFVTGNLERVIEYALVTRRPSPVGTGSTTLISANHGRAMEGAMDFLFREERIARLLCSMRLTSRSPLPDHFQVLLRVDLVDFDEEVVETTCVMHRIYTGH